MKEGSQVAAPDLLTQLYLHAQECTEKEREIEKERKFRSLLDAVSVCLPWGRNKAMPSTQKCMSASIKSCVVCVEGKAVGSSLLALLLLI